MNATSPAPCGDLCMNRMRPFAGKTRKQQKGCLVPLRVGAAVPHPHHPGRLCHQLAAGGRQHVPGPARRTGGSRSNGKPCWQKPCWQIYASGDKYVRLKHKVCEFEGLRCTTKNRQLYLPTRFLPTRFRCTGGAGGGGRGRARRGSMLYYNIS